MKVSEISRLSDDALRLGLKELVAHDRTTTVRLLIHIAEFDSRRLYREEGYESMFRYCVAELCMSEDVAYKRICAARKARKFPKILVSLDEGSLTLTALAMLSRLLTPENAEDLLRAAEHKTNAQVAELIAQRFPRPDLPTAIQPLLVEPQPVVSLGDSPVEPLVESNCQELAARRVESSAQVALPRPRVTPLAPARYGVQFTIDQRDRELLRRAQDLLGHQLPSRDEGEVFVRALRLLVRHLENRKFGATEKPRTIQSPRSKNRRQIPARVRRAVAARDGHRCTFVAQNGRRCEARGFLEFDHVLEVARGGESTLGNLRLRCRAHNRYTAEQSFGARFMKDKIEGAKAIGRAPSAKPSSPVALLPNSSA